MSNTQHYSNDYPSMAWTSVDEVARTGLADVVANKALSVPGAQYKVMSARHERDPALAAPQRRARQVRRTTDQV